MTFQTNFTASNNNFLFATAQDSPKWQLKRSVIYSNVDANHFTEKPKWFVHWHNHGRFTRLLQHFLFQKQYNECFESKNALLRICVK